MSLDAIAAGDRLRATSRSRRSKDRALEVLAWAAFAVTLVPLLAIAGFLISQGTHALSLEFFTQRSAR